MLPVFSWLQQPRQRLVHVQAVLGDQMMGSASPELIGHLGVESYNPLRFLLHRRGSNESTLGLETICWNEVKSMRPGCRNGTSLCPSLCTVSSFSMVTAQSCHRLVFHVSNCCPTIRYAISASVASLICAELRFRDSTSRDAIYIREGLQGPSTCVPATAFVSMQTLRAILYCSSRSVYILGVRQKAQIDVTLLFHIFSAFGRP